MIAFLSNRDIYTSVEGAVVDRHIRLSPKAIRLTDERDAPAAKRSGRVIARCTCDEVVRCPDE